MTVKRIVIAGTFDILHPGHVFLISEAAKLGEVIVVVARDENVVHAKCHPVIVPEQQRLFMVQALKGVSEAILGNPGRDFLAIIEELQPDILLLGPNQNMPIDHVQEELAHRGLKTRVMRLERLFDEYPLNSTSKIIKKAFANRKALHSP
ncbi:MAG: adenylyltransferase/cytidyltransferase family protein [Candidatus Hermodarchaeota archaeon]|nr:adenylyltransferase/cytidyltransferase family protein [Candidatus Hermodarchaeota archaeon]